ncbi:uncharacterized protein LOC108193506 isoform X3 [Daucus carota subsp. sativus]|uniref:uncharacterized protein LOC108193506 isoform X3 n=1 Tax=Daucus carota subsp. sativus TaxID=79200 RepID=UPI0007F00D1F|nr:PREDICTED: uncharacterized protein LOC108193506 isoform X3 [Daucus carota subsp. sativus]
MNEDNNISVVLKHKKMKKAVNIHTLPECESMKLDSLPQIQDPIFKDLEELFEKVKAKVEALKAAGTSNAGTTQFHDMPDSTPDETHPLEKTTENKELDCLCGEPSQKSEETADTSPLRVRNGEDIKELSSCKAILKEYADKINVENPNYRTEKANGSNSTFISSLSFNGKLYVGDEGRNKKESQHLAARAVILSILDSDAPEVISKIIKSKEQMLCPSRGKVQNPCNAYNMGMPARIQTGCDVGTSSSKGNELEVVLSDCMLKTATRDPSTKSSSGVSAKPVFLVEELSSCKAILKEYADKINAENPSYKTEKADGSDLAFVSSLTFNGKQYVGDKGRNKKQSQHLAARAVILSILDSDAHNVISKIIKSKEKMLCPAKGKVQNSCNTQNVGMPAGIHTGYNIRTSSSKGNELEVVPNDNMLKGASQEPCTGNSSSVTAKSVSLVEASATTTLIVPSNVEPLIVGSTSSKKRKRKAKKAKHEVGINAHRVQVAAVPSSQTTTSAVPVL